MFAIALWIILICVFSCGVRPGRSVTVHDMLSNRTIIALGDSITHGYLHDNGTTGYAYSKGLEQLLRGNGTNCTVENWGFPGHKTESLSTLLPGILSSHHHFPVRVVIIFGGTNDLRALIKENHTHGYNHPYNFNTTMSNLIKLHRTVQRYAIFTEQRIFSYVLSLFRIKSGQFAEAERLQLNEALRHHAIRCNETMRFLDTARSFDEPHKGPLISHDGIHPTQLGQHRIADRLYQDLHQWAASLTKQELDAPPMRLC